ncbi:MAG TPA: helix-turn-helix transcriptional regulator [Puia sp.]|nr:helix-turn-helix transcriptional regulator [Puia sp.]
MVRTNHLGRNLRQIRILRGMKQETFARALGVTQQNISKMEKKKDISKEKLETAAKVLGVSVQAIKEFNEKAVLNFAVDQQTGQVIHPVKEVIDYFKEELLKKDKKIEELTSRLERYKKSQKKSSHPGGSSEKSLRRVDDQPAKQANIK